jgi:hypothetical protein
MINPIDHVINIDLANKINMNKSIVIKKNDTDSHKFVINIFNNSLTYDLTGTTSRIYFQKADDTKVFLDCTLDDVLTGKISRLLTTQALSYAGPVASEITIYGDAGEILTSVTFNFTVNENVRDDLAIESTSEFTALTNALNAVNDAVLSIPTVEALNVDLQNNIVTGDALDTTLKADISTGNILDAELKGDITTGDITDAALKGDITTGNALDVALKSDITIGNVLKTDLDNDIAIGGAIQEQEVIRLANEVSRVTTESARVTSEGNRVTAESARVTSEGSRVTAEGTRATAEGTRLTNETIRQNNNTAFKLLEVYDNAHSYIPLNKVTYAGSTYQNIVACIGVLPTDITKWILIAQAGTGSLVVSSATNGNIKIDGTETKVYDDASVVASLADIVQQTHYINTTDNPQTIYNAGAIGDKFVFVKGEHIHNPINNGAILYANKKSTIEIALGAVLKVADNSTTFNITAEIIKNFSNVVITLDDLTVGGTYDNTIASVYGIQIDSVGGVDTFKWTRFWNGGFTTWQAINVPITGGVQVLEKGITIQFGAVTGHNLDSLWMPCYGVNPFYGIRVGMGLQEAYIDSVTISGKGTIDLNMANQFAHNEYTKTLPSCILVNGRVSNIKAEEITMINGARPIQMYGEHTGIYNLDGTTTGGTTYDVDGIIVKNTKINSCSVGHIFGFPEHRGKVKNLSFYGNSSMNTGVLVELNHGLESYNIYGNVYNMVSARQMFTCWRHSKNGTIHDNIMMGDTTGLIALVTFASPTTWEKPEGCQEYNNLNIESFVNGQKSIAFGDITNRAIANCSNVIGGLSNVVNSEYSSIFGGLSNVIQALTEYSVILGGRSNIVNGVYSAIVGGNSNNVNSRGGNIISGERNSVSGNYSNVSGGTDNIVSGFYSNISGGIFNIVSGDKALASGQSNNVSKNYARVHGKEGSTDWVAEDVLASGKFTVAGDAKSSKLTCKGRSTTSTYIPITTNLTDLIIPLHTTVAYKINCVAMNEDDTQQGMWVAQGLITRSAGDVVVKGNTVTKVYADSATWDFLAGAYTPTQSLQLKAKGDVSQNVRWVATVDLTVVKTQ